MKLIHTFDVPNEIETVFEFFADVPAVAACMPGAVLDSSVEDSSAVEDGRYRGRVTIRLGPMSYAFEGEARVSPDRATYSGTIEGSGTDRRGGSRASTTLSYRLTPTDDGTHVEVESDLQLSGPVAQFGRTGLIKDVSDRLVGQFAACLANRLSGSDEAFKAPDLRPLSLIASTLKDGAMRRVRRPAGESGTSPDTGGG